MMPAKTWESQSSLCFVQIATVPYDPRFPATNQARNCYTRYNEYYKCIAVSPLRPSDCSVAFARMVLSQGLPHKASVSTVVWQRFLALAANLASPLILYCTLLPVL